MMWERVLEIGLGLWLGAFLIASSATVFFWTAERIAKNVRNRMPWYHHLTRARP